MNDFNKFGNPKVIFKKKITAHVNLCRQKMRVHEKISLWRLRDAVKLLLLKYFELPVTTLCIRVIGS